MKISGAIYNNKKTLMINFHLVGNRKNVSKMLAIHYCVEAQKSIRNKQEQLTHLLSTEKNETKPRPKQNK